MNTRLLPARRATQLLRDLTKNAFYKEGGGWTRDPEEAKHFTELSEVVAACDLLCINTGEVVEYYSYSLEDAAPSAAEAQLWE